MAEDELDGQTGHGSDRTFEDRVENLDFVLSAFINQNSLEHFKREYNQL